MMLNLRKSLTAALALGLGASLVSGQIFWNPTQSDPYDPLGGNGNWTDAEVWWDGNENITVGQEPGQRAVFQGAGTVGGGTFQPHGYDFSALTGDYSLNFSTELRLSGDHAVTIAGGDHDVFIQSLGYSAGTGANRSVRNDGTGTLTLGDVLRRFGGGTTNLTFHGDGDFALNGAGNMGGTLTKNGEGLLTIGGNMNNFSNGMVLNAGSFFMDNTGTSLTWNGGTLVYELSNTDDSSNTIVLSGAFTKGSGTAFEIDFQNTGIEETYTLLAFDGTTFGLSDFTALNSPQPGTFSFGTTEINDLTYDTLVYTIPEPRVYAVLFGLLALGFVVWRRRR